MTLDLENAILSKSIIHSELFNKELQKKLAREMMGVGLGDKMYNDIDKEIDLYKPLTVPLVGEED